MWKMRRVDSLGLSFTDIDIEGIGRGRGDYKE